MGSILLLHSPAMSGGGVSDNSFKEMQGQQGVVDGNGSGGGSGAEGKRKKNKKEGRA